VYAESQNFPKNRAAVYGEALDVLLKKWAAEKRLKRDPIYRELSPELEQILLAEIAYTSFAADQLFFSKRDITRQIRDFLVNNLNAPKHLDGEAVLTAIEEQQGIFVERARDTYSFSHLTLQEYLTAHYLVDEHQIEQLVTDHLTDERWREVFLLVAGLMGRADEFLELMELVSQRYVNTPKLQALLAWANQETTDSEGNYKPAVKRAAAIFLALNRVSVFTSTHSKNNASYGVSEYIPIFLLSLDSAIANTVFEASAGSYIYDPASKKALKFERLQIFKAVDFLTLRTQMEELELQMPDEEQAIESYQPFAMRVWEVWCKELHLQLEWVDLSESEGAALENYLYANELMVRCKEAAVRVSRESWAGIEERMLTVEDRENV